MSQKPYFSQRFYLLALITIAITLLSVQLVWSKPLTVPINQWHTTAALPEGIVSRNLVAHNDFVYLVGGKNASENPMATIYSAQINTSGGLNAWSVAGQLPMPLYLHAIVVANDALFVIGGWDGKTTRAEVWRASLASDGKVGAWAPMPNYPLPLDLHDAVLLDDRIYVVGGWNGTQAQQVVYSAKLETNGLGPWQLAGNLPQALYRLAVAADGQQLYVTGGYSPGDIASAAVYVAGVNTDGTLLGWQNYSLPAAVYYHKAVIHDGRLVVLGGRDNSQPFAQVYTAAIDTNGSLGGWQGAPTLPAAIYRMGAVTVNRNGSDYIFVAGGARNEADYQTTVYHSDVPLPPAPTSTPSPSPTPTPKLGVILQLRSEPQHWIAPGEELTYFITYENPSTTSLSDVAITNPIPNHVELVANSIQTTQGISSTTGTQPGAIISWQLGTLAGQATGQVSYRVRRPLPPTPVVPPALVIDVEAPAIANQGDQVTYTFRITNNSPTLLTNLVITDTLPAGATYVSGGDSPPVNRIVRWSVPTLLADSSISVPLVVTANQSLVNSDYRVTTKEGPFSNGRRTVVTLVNGQPPLTGDGVILVNEGARITWTSQGETATAESRVVYNPASNLYLPLVRR